MFGSGYWQSASACQKSLDDSAQNKFTIVEKHFGLATSFQSDDLGICEFRFKKISPIYDSGYKFAFAAAFFSCTQFNSYKLHFIHTHSTWQTAPQWKTLPLKRFIPLLPVSMEAPILQPRTIISPLQTRPITHLKPPAPHAL